MSGRERLRGARWLVLCQVALLVASLLAPLSTVAADPSPSPVAPSPTVVPTPSPDPSTPTASPPPDAGPSATAAPSSALGALSYAGAPGWAVALGCAVGFGCAVAIVDAEVGSSIGRTYRHGDSFVLADTPTSDHIVTFASTTSGGQRSEILAAAGADVIDTIPPLRLAVIRVPDGSR